MNLLLFKRSELTEDKRIRVRDRRLDHLTKILRADVGDILRVGEIDGHWGEGRVEAVSSESATLSVVTDKNPPPALDVIVVLALPRPKALRRVLRSVAELGVKEIHLIHSFRVEKSYWQSPLVTEDATRFALHEGLEQSVDTMMPRIYRHRRFRPFAEDVLPQLCAARHALLAHPYARHPYPPAPSAPGVLLIGPEGGFIPFENDLMCRAGACAVTLGPRILKVETALNCCLAAYALPRL